MANERGLGCNLVIDIELVTVEHTQICLVRLPKRRRRQANKHITFLFRIVLTEGGNSLLGHTVIECRGALEVDMAISIFRLNCEIR